MRCKCRENNRRSRAGQRGKRLLTRATASCSHEHGNKLHRNPKQLAVTRPPSKKRFRDPTIFSLSCSMAAEREVLREQLEFYFSDSNYPRDKFLRAEASKHDGCTRSFWPFHWIINLVFSFLRGFLRP
jgi:hypothetical protein